MEQELIELLFDLASDDSQSSPNESDGSVVKKRIRNRKRIPLRVFKNDTRWCYANMLVNALCSMDVYMVYSFVSAFAIPTMRQCIQVGEQLLGVVSVGIAEFVKAWYLPSCVSPDIVFRFSNASIANRRDGTSEVSFKIYTEGSFVYQKPGIETTTLECVEDSCTVGIKRTRSGGEFSESMSDTSVDEKDRQLLDELAALAPSSISPDAKKVMTTGFVRLSLDTERRIAMISYVKLESVPMPIATEVGADEVPPLEESEYNSLQELYDSTGGEYWTYRGETGSYWNFDGVHNPCAEGWLGLNCTCTTTACNIEIFFLYNYNMTGSIPSSIDSFSKAAIMVLSDNHLNQEIPASIGNLQALEMLILAENDLTGTIPETLFDLTLLPYLDLSANYLRGALSSSVSKMTALTALILDLNELTNTLPASLSSLPSLEVLQVSDNHLNGSLADLSSASLGILRLSSNRLTSSLPADLGTRFPRLKVLQLSDNFMTGSIPTSVGALNLSVLSLDTNGFFGSLPKELGNSRFLGILDLFDNAFEGPLPYTFSKFERMFYLRLYDNHFTGPIPSGLNNMDQLRYLQLNLNKFSQSIPVGLFQLPNIVIFDLSDNALTGSIPTPTTPVVNSTVQYLFLYQNHLRGSIPASLSSLLNMKYLDLSKNQLSSAIPDVTGLDALVSFDLRTNLLSSTIPDTLCSLTNIRLFDLHENVLSGTLPSSLNLMENLQNLFVHNNALSGTICGMVNSTFQRKVVNIDVSSNQFTGNLPVEPFLIASLETFAAAANCLLGDIPTEVCGAQRLTDLVLDGYQTASSCREKIFPLIPTIETYTLSTERLYGNTIPDCLFSLPLLQTLHLSGNGLTGSIPNSIIVSTSLTDLSLSHNVIKGSIPDVLMIGSPGGASRDAWLNLDLSYNRISGILAASFPSINESQTLSLQVNRLSGFIPSSLVNALHITMLDGNIFSCDSAMGINDDQNSRLPRHDEDFKIYECGSNSFNQSIYLWIILSVLLALGILTVTCTALYVQRSKISQLKLPSQPGIQSSGSATGLSDVESIENATQSALSSGYFRHSSWVRWLHSREVQRQQYMAVFSVEAIMDPNQDRSIFEFGQIMVAIRQVAVYLTAVIIVVFFPLYAVLTTYYSTYEHEYAYFFSAAFLSGQTPALTLFFALFAFLVLLLLLYHRHLYRFLRGGDASQGGGTGGGGGGRDESFSTDIRLSFSQGLGISKYTKEGRKQSLARYYSFVTLLIIANCIVVIGINVLYVYISLNYNKFIVTFTQVLLAMFKLFWNGFIVFDFFQYLKRMYFVNENDKSVGSPSAAFANSEFDAHASMVANRGNSTHRYEHKDVLVQSFIVMFNNIASPCLAIAVISSNCFYNAFFLPPSVNSSYNFQFCTSIQVSDGSCLQYVTETHYTTYLPPFIYSYQCSSIFITNYTAIYVYLFILTTFGVPLFAFALAALYRRWQSDRDTLTFRFLDFALPEILKPLARELPMEYGSLLNVDKVCVVIINSFAIMVTFGVLFPPLAVVICASMLLGTYTIQLLIGKIVTTSSALGYSHYQIRLEEECYKVRKVFQHPIWLLVFFAAIFYAIFLYDILGDAVGMLRALWAPLCMIGIPFAIYFLVFLHQWTTRSLRAARQRERTGSGGYGYGERERANSTGSNRSNRSSRSSRSGSRSETIKYHVVSSQGNVILTPISDE